MLDGLAQPIPQISIHGRIISSSQRSWIGIKHSIISLISLGAHHLYSSSESKSEIPCIFASQSAKSAALLIDLVFKFSVFCTYISLSLSFPGTPINRLPIMAKQVLDLYELYNLVTSRGGLVEVINKKQWQEIIKGLNLPSSITSAAFTLRTQWVHAIIAKWIFLLKSIFFSVKTQLYLIPNIGYGTNLNSLWIHEKLFLPSTSLPWFSSPQLYRR